MKKLSQKFATFSQDFRNVHQEAKKQGFVNIMKLLWKDLFVGRTAFQWIYLLLLSSVPFVLEFMTQIQYLIKVLFHSNGSFSIDWTNLIGQHDWLGLFASWTGIVCVILVAEGRASNYLFGAVNSAIYLVLALNKNFYGEVLTTLYFFIMQPIGLYVWLSNRINDQGKVEESHFEAKKLNLIEWMRYLALCAVIWIGMGFAYQSIHSARPFRDSITDATNGVGQLLMTRLYREQWIFWIATNVFSIYLWWDQSIQIQGMYWVYTLNSLVGWYQWTKALKKEVA
ncbi:nicotinamide riboside transporter PnuC [Streptococcus parasanguinis]|mgnify:FL=1|uniref:nicotinamide riboside transporter PnuC n=1 Tax=Streptococcus TaxID=1301 RepID=UPI0008A3C9EA|nr:MULTISPECIES: nicotinamide riboside transporter PnuC [Streptococcus]MBZ2091048.1 nicotinamide riboside transporter PnuC [Streptococcus parasanguinis]OFQ85244.1 nicotinamide mononucleotide transporter PnuC [Streptococcus sp. HMSC061E03]